GRRVWRRRRCRGSRRCVATCADPVGSPRPRRLRARRRPSLRIWRRGLSGASLYSCSSERLLVLLRQRVAPVEEQFAYATLVGRLKDFEAVCASLLELLALDFRELRQVSHSPFVLHEFERVVFAQRVAVPVRRKKKTTHVRVVLKTHSEQIEDFALHPVRRGPHRRNAL